jgi:hypothetical protein
VAAFSKTDELSAQRPTIDRAMRRLLRVGDDVDRGAVLRARRNTTTAIVIAGIRCLITYIFIPVLAPYVVLVRTIGAPLSIALSVLGITMGISATRRFWVADHRYRWAYTGFIAVVVVLLIVGIGLDLGSMLRSTTT